MNRQELNTAVKQYIDRSSEESLSGDSVNLWIDIVTSKLNIALREHPRMLERKFYTIPQGQCLIPLPEDMIFLRTLRRGETILVQVPVTIGTIPEDCFKLRGDVAELESGVSADTTFTMDFAQGLHTDNWIMEIFPHVYLDGCLVEASEWLRDFKTAEIRKKKFDSGVVNLISQGWNEQIAATPRVTIG